MTRLIPLLILFCFTSCYGNSFYFDIDKQEIIRCDDGYMQEVSIYPLENTIDKNSLTPESDCDLYSIRENKQSIFGEKNIKLKGDNKNYNVFFKGKLIPDGKILLKPNTIYNVVHRSNPDASVSSITIETDKNGTVIKSSQTCCE